MSPRSSAARGVRLWRRFPFTVRFTTIVAAAGLLVAALATVLTNGQAQIGAMGRSSDRVGIAKTLMAQELADLRHVSEAFTAEVGTGGGPALLRTHAQADPGTLFVWSTTQQ